MSSNMTPNNKLQESDASQYGQGDRSTPPSGSVRHLTPNMNGRIRFNDDDLLASQIEPPTFLVEFNDIDTTQSETNEYIQQIERNVEYPQSQAQNFRQGYMYAYAPSYPQRYEEDMRYYQHPGYQVPHPASQYRQESQYEQVNKEAEYMNNMMSQGNYMGYDTGMMPRSSPQSKQNLGLDNYGTPEAFLKDINPEWSEMQSSKKEKLLKEFLTKFLAFQVVEVSNESQAEKGFWDW